MKVLRVMQSSVAGSWSRSMVDYLNALSVVIANLVIVMGIVLLVHLIKDLFD
jgi:hypothetical protein